MRCALSATPPPARSFRGYLMITRACKPQPRVCSRVYATQPTTAMQSHANAAAASNERLTILTRALRGNGTTRPSVWRTAFVHQPQQPEQQQQQHRDKRYKIDKRNWFSALGALGARRRPPCTTHSVAASSATGEHINVRQVRQRRRMMYDYTHAPESRRAHARQARSLVRTLLYAHTRSNRRRRNVAATTATQCEQAGHDTIVDMIWVERQQEKQALRKTTT